ncbi:hypothetical protein EBO15_36520 [Actinomadura harenae]|uniref:Uncharacterized protein n=1 Tax=Actinomadura harenae TaxID=2483351 RepID=A0A3M2LIB4_9ACTN|nr:hypothetical protein EBO15_36520 [Actinomadura harenae]
MGAEWDGGVGGVRVLNAADARGLRWMLGRVAVWDAEVAGACAPSVEDRSQRLLVQASGTDAS